jgi:hypothetical protein
MKFGKNIFHQEAFNFCHTFKIHTFRWYYSESADFYGRNGILYLEVNGKFCQSQTESNNMMTRGNVNLFLWR